MVKSKEKDLEKRVKNLEKKVDKLCKKIEEISEDLNADTPRSGRPCRGGRAVLVSGYPTESLEEGKRLLKIIYGKS